MKFLRVASLVLAAAIAIFVLVGIFLPRQWNVEVTTISKATPAQVMPLVRDFREWSKWTTAMPETTYSYSDQQGQVGAWMSWSGAKSRAKFTIVELTDTKVKFDEQMEADEVNAHGEITAVPETNGTRLTWKDTGTLPPILGGYFKGIIENALTEHMKLGLGKLSQVAETNRVETAAPAVVPTTETPVADAGVEEADAGTAAAAAPTDEAQDAGATPPEGEADAGATP